ncbi:MAG: hypothetical protein Q9171_004874 [Xanthocarpia ochracea]
MHCKICQRPYNTALSFNCPTCARDVLYQTRASVAHTLLEQEAASSQLEQYLTDSQTIPTKPSASNTSNSQSRSLSLNIGSITLRREAVRHQTQLTLHHAEQLRLEASKVRDEIARRKAKNQERRNGIIAARKEMARRETVDVSRLEKSVAGIHNRWNTMHSRTAESRLLLCREAANLYGLKKYSNRVATSASDTYLIGGLPIYNLKDLNNADPAIITTVTSSLAHLVHLVSHYLALRLPAEVILPHRDCPSPTILAPASSYITKSTPYSRATSAKLSSNDSSAIGGIVRTSRKRVSTSLYTKKRLSTTAKEDPQLYTAVIEGIALLAWNVAWLCKTQGSDVGANSWEEICDVGKNLWDLFAAEQAGSKFLIDVHNRTTKQDGRPKSVLRASQQNVEPSPKVLFGEYSHGTVYSNLSTASGSKVMLEWRLQDPTQVIDRVKQMLLSDRTGAGWEMLEGKEWESQSMIADQAASPAVVDASTVVLNAKSGTEQISRDPGLEPNDLATEEEQEKARGTSGWTKLKSR